MTDILKVADDAKMIVNGYAYTPKENHLKWSLYSQEGFFGESDV